MAEIELVIRIPEESYKAICYRQILRSDVENVVQGVKTGIPLPKGHGRLIDADEIQFENNEFDTYSDYNRAFDTIDYATTIIEADKAESEDKDENNN